MSIDYKKEQQKKRLAKQLRINLMRRKAQTRQRTTDNINEEILADDVIKDDIKQK